MSRTQVTGRELSAASFGPPQLEHSTLAPSGSSDRSSDIQLSHVFEISPDLLALASFKERRWVRVNPAFRTLLGWNENDLTGRPLLDIVHSADHDRMKLIEEHAKQPNTANLQVRVLCRGGGCRWIAWHIAPDEEAQALWFIGRDVTHRRRTMRNLRVTSVRVQRENENLEHFVKAAAHDLQEPLRTLSMYSELLMRRYSSEMPGQSAELLAEIFGAAGRMHALVRDLLVYASLSKEQGAPSQTFISVSLQHVLDDALESLKSSIEECSAIVTHDPLPHVQGDDTQLTQLLQNLLSNSLKYRCPDQPASIHIGVERICGEWRFQIKDNGLGFDPKYADEIFLDFKRLHGRNIPGTGLGLTICRRIVQRHGGRIWAEGTPGKGATFFFTLPTCNPAHS